MPLDSLGVDTSLDTSTGFEQTGAAGIDTPAAPWLDPAVMMPQVTSDQFQQVQSEAPLQFSTVDPGTGNKAVRQQMVDYAKQYLGMQYHWGGSNPNTSFDCSGFIQWVYKKFGVNLPRVSFQQANYGQRVTRDQAMVGDIVSWDNSSRNNGADHVALYLGNGKIMEFYSSGKPSRIRSLGAKENYAVTRIKLRGE